MENTSKRPKLDKINLVVAHCMVDKEMMGEAIQLLREHVANDVDWILIRPNDAPRTQDEIDKDTFAIQYTKRRMEPLLNDPNSICLTSRTVVKWLMDFDPELLQVHSLSDNVTSFDILAIVAGIVANKRKQLKSQQCNL